MAYFGRDGQYITGSQDCIVNLHGEGYGDPELDLYPCQKWGEASSHISRKREQCGDSSK